MIMSRSAAAMVGRRAAFARVLSTPCTIQRGGMTVAETTCSINPEQASVFLVSQDRLEPLQRWIVLVPWGTDLRRGDVVEALGQRYVMTSMASPRSFALATEGVALQEGAAADDPGTPGVDEATDDLIHANVTVRVRRHVRDPLTKQTRLQGEGPAFPARVDDISNTLTEQGMGPVFMLKLVCSASVDIQDGDIVSSIDPPVATMPTVAQVQHVATERVNSGLVYKTALIVEQVQAGGG